MPERSSSYAKTKSQSCPKIRKNSNERSGVSAKPRPEKTCPSASTAYRTQSQKLFANLIYSYGRPKSNVVSGSGSSFDPYDFSEEFAPTPFDGAHNVGGFFSLNLPHKVSLFGDFSVSSGAKFNITTGRDTNGDGYFSERPSFASDLNKAGLISTQYGILDPNPSPNDKLIPRNLGRGKTTFIRMLKLQSRHLRFARRLSSFL